MKRIILRLFGLGILCFEATSSIGATMLITKSADLSLYNANLLASITNGPQTTAIWFEWGVDTNYGHFTPATIVQNANTLNISNLVIGLTPYMTYHCQAVASNVFGAVYGGDIAFTTVPKFVEVSSNASWSALVLSGDGHELVITSNGIICVSTNLGLTFMPTTGIGSVFATSSNGLSILSVSGANLYVSTNRGATWTTNTTPATFVQFAASSDARVIAASDGRLGVYVSTNFAQSWNSNVLSDPISGGYYISRSTTYSLACSADGSHIYGAATTSVELNSYGWIFGSTNFGATWNVYDQSGGFVLSVACSSGGTIVFYSQYGYAGGQVSTNSGTSWSGYGVQGQGNIACSADGKVAVLNTVSTGYGIGVSPNMGTTWYAANCPIQQGDVMSSADGNTLVASSYGAIYISKPPPNLPVSFASSFTSSNGVPTFVVAGQPGYSYMVETSSDLINWTTIASLINTNGTVPFTDPAGMNYTQRFYRVVVGP